MRLFLAHDRFAIQHVNTVADQHRQPEMLEHVHSGQWRHAVEVMGAGDEGRGAMCYAVRIEGLSEQAAARRFGIEPRTVSTKAFCAARF